MKERLDAIKENALSQIKATDSLDKLNDIRVAFLGKKGELTEVLKGILDNPTRICLFAMSFYPLLLFPDLHVTMPPASSFHLHEHIFLL